MTSRVQQGQAMFGEGGFGGGLGGLPIGGGGGGGSVGCGGAILAIVIVLLLCAAFAYVIWWGLQDVL